MGIIFTLQTIADDFEAKEVDRTCRANARSDSTWRSSMTLEEAAEIVRQRYDDADGCRSCGWKSALYEFGQLEQWIDEEDIAEGRVFFSCQSEDASENGRHKGYYVYLTRASDQSTGDT